MLPLRRAFGICHVDTRTTKLTCVIPQRLHVQNWKLPMNGAQDDSSCFCLYSIYGCAAVNYLRYILYLRRSACFHTASTHHRTSRALHNARATIHLLRAPTLIVARHRGMLPRIISTAARLHTYFTTTSSSCRFIFSSVRKRDLHL